MEFTKDIQITKRNRIISVIEDISKNPHKYSMDGTLKILKSILKEDFEKHVIIKNSPYFEFKPNEVEKLEQENGKIVLYVNRFGVTHKDNTIPDEKILELAKNSTNSHQLSTFFNTFNNRLLHLSFKISEKFTPSISSEEFLNSFYGKILNALSGNVFPKYPELRYNNTNSLWASKRTNSTLKLLLESLTGLKIDISKAYGGFDEVTDTLFYLGQENNVLGKNTYLGNHVFNPTKYIKIFINIDHDKLLYFVFQKLPEVMEFTKNYLHFVIDFQIYLRIKKSTISPLDFKSRKVFLGVNSFLTSNSQENYENEPIITPKILEKIINHKPPKTVL